MVGTKQIFAVILTIVFVLVAVWWSFNYFYQDIYDFIKVDSEYTVLFDEVGVTVTIADEPAEWQQGLSGISKLEDLEGKLFVFEKADIYGFWMKDMLIPIDIIWIDDAFTVVHIEERVTPNTYPKNFYPPVPARFVLEVNAAFVESFKLSLGSKVKLPSAIIPKDLQ